MFSIRSTRQQLYQSEEYYDEKTGKTPYLYIEDYTNPSVLRSNLEPKFLSRFMTLSAVIFSRFIWFYLLLRLSLGDSEKYKILEFIENLGMKVGFFPGLEGSVASQDQNFSLESSK